MFLITILSASLSAYMFINYTPQSKVLGERIELAKDESTRFAEKQVLSIQTYFAPVVEEAVPLIRLAGARIASFFDTLRKGFFIFPFVETTQIATSDELLERIEALEKTVVALSLDSDTPTISSSLTISSLTTDTLLATTINSNTFNSNRLIFSGDAPSIYPSTKNSKISLNAAGTGAINIGNAGTGDIYLGGGSGDSGCTLTNNNGTFNCSGNITSAGDLIANGGDILTDKTTLNLGGSSTTINIPGNTTLAGTLSVTGTSTFASDISVSSGGQLTLTRIPTKAHTGTWTIGSSTWNQADATIYVNPASATADSNIFALSVGGSVKFDVDAEGDVYANNLILTGNTTSATTTVSGTLTVEGNTTLGDATTDTLTINPATLTWAGGNKTIDITGAATRTLTLLNSTASQVADLDLSDGSLKLNSTTIISNAGALSNITGYTQSSGTFSQTSTTASGNILTVTDTSLTGSGANLANFTFKNANTGAGVTVSGITITEQAASTPSSGTNTSNLINLSAAAGGTVNGINIDSATGFTNFLKTPSAVLDSSGNLSGVVTLTATTLAGTLSTAAQTNITSVGTLGSLTVTGNVNSSTGALQTNGVTRIDNSGNLTAGTGSFSGTVTVGSGTGKIDVGTVDPPYTIDGKKYATYLAGMIGQKEETSGTVRLGQTGKFDIEFNKVTRGSDLWLFYQITDFGKDWENLTTLLTPSFEGKVWYVKDPIARKLTIFGSSFGEVSYRFTAPRFDYQNWPNIRIDGPSGFVIKEK